MAGTPPPILGAGSARPRRWPGCADLSQRETLDALSLASLSVASCPGEIKYSRDAVIRAVREGLPAEAAVRATALAALGVRGFDEPFEGKRGLLPAVCRRSL